MQTMALISVYAGRDYYSRGPRDPVFLLLGFPTAAELDVECDGAAAGSILALERTATTRATVIARPAMRRPGEALESGPLGIAART
jgi:hypothetical protein